MRRGCMLLAGALFALAWGGRAAALTLPPIRELVFASAKYDGQEVEVAGRVRELETKTSKAGRAYVVFKLVDDRDRWVRVFAWGSPVVYEGRSVKVTGVFRAEKKVGENVFKKEIEASDIR